MSAPGNRAVLIGNSDGIGLALTRRLLDAGWTVSGLSSLADAAISREAPGYGASKAGMSMYLRGLALALRPHGVDVTTPRRISAAVRALSVVPAVQLRFRRRRI